MYERTFFVTSVTHSRRAIFTIAQNAYLFVDVIQQCRREEKFRLHAFVVMPEHFHILMTPADNLSLEKCVQFVKGRFSYRFKSRLPVWQPSFENHRIRDDEDFRRHLSYIHSNPVKRLLVVKAEEYAFSSANPEFRMDSVLGLKPTLCDLDTRR